MEIDDLWDWKATDYILLATRVSLQIGSPLFFLPEKKRHNVRIECKVLCDIGLEADVWAK